GRDDVRPRHLAAGDAAPPRGGPVVGPASGRRVRLRDPVPGHHDPLPGPAHLDGGRGDPEVADLSGWRRGADRKRASTEADGGPALGSETKKGVPRGAARPGRPAPFGGLAFSYFVTSPILKTPSSGASAAISVTVWIRAGSPSTWPARAVVARLARAEA